VGLSGQVLRDFSLSKKAFWPLQAPYIQTTFPKWPCSVSGSVYNLAVQWLALPPNKPQYCRPGDSCKSGAFVLKIVRQLLTIELRLRARVIQNGLSAQIIGKDNAGNNRDPKQDCRNSKKLEVVEPTSQGE
jgi:hypothetical protein